jgi:hypothetical protein
LDDVLYPLEPLIYFPLSLGLQKLFLSFFDFVSPSLVIAKDALIHRLYGERLVKHTEYMNEEE